MQATSNKIQSILRSAVDDSAKVRCINDEMSLSPYLSGSFNLYKGSALGTTLMFAEDISNKDGAAKRLETLIEALGEPVVAVRDSATASEKRSLINARQGFITLYGEMYIPQLALALKNETKRKRGLLKRFSPSQQQAFLYCLLQEGDLTQDGLRDKTGMSAAGASRALSSLADEGLIDYEVSGKTGRKRIYFIPDKIELFRRGRKLFGDPVRSVERVSAASVKDSLISGLSALARRSDLVAPARKVAAIGPNAIINEATDDWNYEDLCLVQRLSYDPTPFAEGNMVDPFTMLVTIDDEDERISIALREALEEFSWFTD